MISGASEEELEEQYNAINKYQEKMEKESNYYYEPTIKTARNEKYPKRMFFEKQEYIPKQQLVSWIENKMKEYSKLIKNPNYRNQVKCLIYTYQEILDFINKGDKNE